MLNFNKSSARAMMRNAVVATIALGGAAGCSDFVTVPNPNTVEAGGIDPATDGPMIAWSAFQDFVSAFGTMTLNTAFFTTEAWTGDSSEGRSEVGRRAIDPANAPGWAVFARALASTENAIDILAEAPDATKNVHLARVNLGSGYGYQMMAEIYCEGTVRGGPRLTTAEMLELAITRFTAARTIGAADGTAAGTAIANAASVGLGRALLQAGRNPDAAAAVAGIPANFEFLLYNADDPANRDRLGNWFWQATADRAALVVPPVYRAAADAGDTRVRYQDTGVRAYDGFLQMYAQRKYTGWASSYRLASGLLARYIAVEASGDQSAMLAFVNERRAANKSTAVNLTGDALLAEFLWQKSLDFWLEGIRMGDFRRHGAKVGNVIPTGADFYKPAAGPVGDDVCFPIPLIETSTNPHFR